MAVSTACHDNVFAYLRNFAYIMQSTKERMDPLLEDQHERRTRLLDSMPAIAWSASARSFRFTYVNPAAERMLGYPTQRWIDEPQFWTDHLHPEDRHVANFCHDQTLACRDHELVYRMIAADGRVVWLRDCVRIHSVDGVAVELFGVMVDITREREATRKLDEARRMSSLGQVAASLAHEFNNVLMGIQPFVEVIAAHAPATRSVSDAIGHITRAIGRGKRASQEILRFANPKEPQLLAIDVQAWLPTLLGQLVAALPSTIALSSSVEPSVRFICGDREHLEQVITNLVFNARDAIRISGTIHIGLSLTATSTNNGADADFVRISVYDDGAGIAPETLEKIFEPLFTTKRNGTGLGLSIARRLMEGQGGTLTAENRPDGGSAFHLLVPTAQTSSPSMQPFNSATPGIKHILLVEDDLSVGAGLEELLNSEGYETTWVRGSEDARIAARQSRPQVAIIDVNLPDGNGIDLIALLRAEYDDLPVVLSTGHVELNLSCGKKRIFSLMKPYELRDLLAAIGQVTAAA